MKKSDELNNRNYFRGQLQQLVRACNHTVHVLTAVKDMVQGTAQRDLGISVLESQITELRQTIQRTCLSISDVADEYLLPRSDMKLEFGMHDLNHAYLNYKVPNDKKLTEGEYIDIESAMRKMADEIVADINEYEDNDELGERVWVVQEEPNFFDKGGIEFQDYDLSQLHRAKVIQVAIMRAG